jgi:DNA-binding winged helix-turn-helix (wHTH) protein
MSSGVYEFDRFRLDAAERRLLQDGRPVDVSTRYFDALLLMVENPGQLISRDRFLDEAWRGVPVTDEALSQCITQLRKQLGDTPARPRFIETVPKHGYRFVAPVSAAGAMPAQSEGSRGLADILSIALPAAVGGAGAGIIGGLVYGLGVSVSPGAGTASVLMVLLALGLFAGALGGLGVGLGLGVARTLGPRRPLIDGLGAAAGGGIVGMLVTMLGLDGATILLGRAPSDIGGALEGIVIGLAVGLGAHLVSHRGWPSVRGSAVATAAAGALLPLLGGRMMGASLAGLTEAYPKSQIVLTGFGRIFGESGFGPITQSVFGALEGFVFGAIVALAMRYSLTVRWDRRDS